ncbi:transcription initiation factor IIF, beta subunit [Auriculariales sp. MPI-PUGE-AT-0066]|nr:transcription initiation factor IIF, beta subunit [Auriculariales sp. MPI-PUGE-AT-0066]
MDEKKPVNLDDGPREQEPDPEEEMNLSQAGNDVWLVKMPKFLLQRWSSVTEAGVKLGTIRVYEQHDPVTNMPRVEILLPEHDNPELTVPTASTSAAGSPQDSAQSSQQDEHQAAVDRVQRELDAFERRTTKFDLEILRPGDVATENQLVVGSKSMRMVNGMPSRARETFRKGKVKNICSMQPYMDASYRKIIRERTRLANTPKRTTVVWTGDHDMDGIAGPNAPSMQEVNASWLAQKGPAKQQQKKGEFERMARIAKNELLDKLFQLFTEKPLWQLKDLRTRTQQPEGYLRDTLLNIAFLHRKGEHNNFWELTPDNLAFVGSHGAKAEPGSSSGSLPALRGADAEDEFGDDGDEDDMEDVQGLDDD